MESSLKIYSHNFNQNVNIIRYTSSIFSKIVDFNDKVIDALEKLEKEGVSIDEEHYDYILELNYLAYKHLCVTNSRDYNKILGAIGANELLVNRGVIDHDVECLT